MKIKYVERSQTKVKNECEQEDGKRFTEKFIRDHAEKLRNNRAWFRFFGLLISATAGTLYDLRKSHSNLEIQIMVQTSDTMLSLLQEFPCCSICSRNCYFT